MEKISFGMGFQKFTCKYQLSWNILIFLITLPYLKMRNLVEDDFFFLEICVRVVTIHSASEIVK